MDKYFIISWVEVGVGEYISCFKTFFPIRYLVLHKICVILFLLENSQSRMTGMSKAAFITCFLFKSVTKQRIKFKIVAGIWEAEDE